MQEFHRSRVDRVIQNNEWRIKLRRERKSIQDRKEERFNSICEGKRSLISMPDNVPSCFEGKPELYPFPSTSLGANCYHSITFFFSIDEACADPDKRSSSSS